MLDNLPQFQEARMQESIGIKLKNLLNLDQVE